MSEYLIFTDDVDPITKPNLLELNDDQFWKIFGKGRDTEMLNYDLVEGWLEESGFTAQYGERYMYWKDTDTDGLRMAVGWTLAFDTPEQAFAFKMRWL
jgi:hypothetical protein